MPPRKKGSGKKKKLANMTEEERLLYLEQKQLAEEEMRKNKEDLLTQFLKVYLFRFCKAFLLIAIIFCIANKRFSCSAINVRLIKFEYILVNSVVISILYD